MNTATYVCTTVYLAVTTWPVCMGRITMRIKVGITELGWRAFLFLTHLGHRLVGRSLFLVSTVIMGRASEIFAILFLSPSASHTDCRFWMMLTLVRTLTVWS